ncbi:MULTISPECIES: hypothetical protein [unclassified Ensifer]|uniref:hypothetical protein n=1 Tax=unclassified Ensifer TaxID=2633371 RepID=UPI0030101157
MRGFPFGSGREAPEGGKGNESEENAEDHAAKELALAISALDLCSGCFKFGAGQGEA